MSDDRPAVLSVEEQQLAELRKIHADVLALVANSSGDGIKRLPFKEIMGEPTDSTDTPEAAERETQQGKE